MTMGNGLDQQQKPEWYGEASRAARRVVDAMLALPEFSGTASEINLKMGGKSVSTTTDALKRMADSGFVAESNRLLHHGTGSVRALAVYRLVMTDEESFELLERAHERAWRDTSEIDAILRDRERLKNLAEAFNPFCIK